MTDDTITEVMINGKDNIFIEQNGRVKTTGQVFLRRTGDWKI